MDVIKTTLNLEFDDPPEDRIPQNQAIFRLGQMGMQQSVILMLRNQAKVVRGVLRSELLEAAELVQKMEVLHEL